MPDRQQALDLAADRRRQPRPRARDRAVEGVDTAFDQRHQVVELRGDGGVARRRRLQPREQLGRGSRRARPLLPCPQRLGPDDPARRRDRHPEGEPLVVGEDDRRRRPRRDPREQLEAVALDEDAPPVELPVGGDAHPRVRLLDDDAAALPLRQQHRPGDAAAERTHRDRPAERGDRAISQVVREIVGVQDHPLAWTLSTKTNGARASSERFPVGTIRIVRLAEVAKLRFQTGACHVSGPRKPYVSMRLSKTPST